MLVFRMTLSGAIGQSGKIMSDQSKANDFRSDQQQWLATTDQQ
jgi:hypothetical protein